MSEETDASAPPALIVICRDLPGDHLGGPGCWCIPGVFDVDDDVGIQRFLDEQDRIVS